MQGLGVEQLRPVAASLLHSLEIAGQHQVDRVGWGAHRGDANLHPEIGGFQDSLCFKRVITGPLLENHHLRVIVHREGLIGKLVVQTDRANGRRRLEDFYQVKAQLALEHAGLGYLVTIHNIPGGWTAQQRPVVNGGHREAFRQARQCAPLAVGRHDDVIGLVDDLDKPL